MQGQYWLSPTDWAQWVPVLIMKHITGQPCWLVNSALRTTPDNHSHGGGQSAQGASCCPLSTWGSPTHLASWLGWTWLYSTIYSICVLVQIFCNHITWTLVNVLLGISIYTQQKSSQSSPEIKRIICRRVTHLTKFWPPSRLTVRIVNIIPQQTENRNLAIITLLLEINENEWSATQN